VKIQFSTIDKIVFAVIAVLAAVVVALIVFGCDGQAVDTDGWSDAAADTDTDTEDADTDTEDAGADDDGGNDAGFDTAPPNPCPFACTATVDFCLEINGQIVPGDCTAFPTAVCCHLEYWSDAGV
jgi:hypothetical protein